MPSRFLEVVPVELPGFDNSFDVFECFKEFKQPSDLCLSLAAASVACWLLHSTIVIIGARRYINKMK